MEYQTVGGVLHLLVLSHCLVIVMVQGGTNIGTPNGVSQVLHMYILDCISTFHKSLHCSHGVSIAEIVSIPRPFSVLY